MPDLTCLPFLVPSFLHAVFAYHSDCRAICVQKLTAGFRNQYCKLLGSNLSQILKTLRQWLNMQDIHVCPHIYSKLITNMTLGLEYKDFCSSRRPQTRCTCLYKLQPCRTRAAPCLLMLKRCNMQSICVKLLSTPAHSPEDSSSVLQHSAQAHSIEVMHQ